MSTAKKVSVKNSAKNAATKNAIVSVNLSQFEKKLSTINVKEKSSKETIYNYPENFTPKMIGDKDGKQFRNKLRNKIKMFENNIFAFAKSKQDEKLLAEIKSFNEFYKVNYKINDYSLKSISQSADELKTGDLTTMLDIVKAVNGQISPKTAPKTATKK